MDIIHVFVLMVVCVEIQESSSEILQRKKRTWIIDSFEIDEGRHDFPYSLGEIKIEKNLTLYKIHGPGVDEEPKGLLTINSRTGEITVHKAVDYEIYQSLMLTFQAMDIETHVIDTQLGIEINIIDANDNPPIFDQITYKAIIEESKKQGTAVNTVKATDADSSEEFKKLDFSIVSVEPKPDDLEFYIEQSGNDTANILFKGCLDHEKTERYSLKVEARDHGPTPLSGFCTVIIDIKDGNNHLPVITQQKGPARVKEGEKDVVVSRLQVTDEDTKGTEAWRAKYQIQGDTNSNFKIDTDPETNEGLLRVEKPLSYEDGSTLKVNITVENEIPYYSCKVEKRTNTGLWKVSTVSGVTGAMSGGVTGTQGSSTHQVTVTVEDVNEAPVFDKSQKTAQMFENQKPGQHLATFTAKDPDITSGNTFKYIKGEDPADWVTVDPHTGRVTTSKIIDHESPYVKDSMYVVTVYAVDDGEPPATSTATLSIHITDENDHAPTLTVSTIDMCQSTKPSKTNITVLDLDKEPYGGPFHFRLHGDVEGKWRVDPEQGFEVNLVKENTVYSGHHVLTLEVSDRQGHASVHNLTVTVCGCLDTSRPDCKTRKLSGSTAGPGTLVAAAFSMLLFVGLLLLALLLSCEREIAEVPDNIESRLMMSKDETPGDDCKVVPLQPNREMQVIYPPPPQEHGYPPDLRWQLRDESVNEYLLNAHQDHERYSQFRRNSGKSWSINASSVKRLRHQENHWGSQTGRKSHSSMYRNRASEWKSFHMSNASLSMGRENYSKHQLQQFYTLEEHQHWKMLSEVITILLSKLQEPCQELYDYEPHVYAEEGTEEDYTYELDAISIPDVPFDQDMDLDVRFSTLASICMPSESAAHSTTTSCSGSDWTVMKSNQMTASDEILNMEHTTYNSNSAHLFNVGISEEYVVIGQETDTQRHRSVLSDFMDVW